METHQSGSEGAAAFSQSSGELKGRRATNNRAVQDRGRFIFDVRVVEGEDVLDPVVGSGVVSEIVGGEDEVDEGDVVVAGGEGCVGGLVGEVGSVGGEVVGGQEVGDID